MCLALNLGSPGLWVALGLTSVNYILHSKREGKWADPCSVNLRSGCRLKGNRGETGPGVSLILLFKINETTPKAIKCNRERGRLLLRNGSKRACKGMMYLNMLLYLEAASSSKQRDTKFKVPLVMQRRLRIQVHVSELHIKMATLFAQCHG